MTSKNDIATPTNGAERAVAVIPPPVMVLLAIVSIQVGAALAVGLFPVLGPVGTVFWRLTISTIILIVIIRPSFDTSVWQHRNVLLPYGIVLGSMNWLFYESVARIPLGITVAIEFMGPLFVAALMSRRRIDIVWLALAIGGLLLLTPKIGEELDVIGVTFAVGAGIGWALFVILSKRVSADLPGDSGLVFGMVIASLWVLPFALPNIGAIASETWVIGVMLGVALLSTTIPFYLEFAALKKLTAHTYGILVTLEPAAAAVIGAIMLGEFLGVTSVLAIVCVTIAAAGATWTREK